MMTAAVFFSYSIYTLYPNVTSAAIGRMLPCFWNKTSRPTSRLSFPPHTTRWLYLHYYQGTNRILPDEGFFDGELEAAPGTADALRKQTDYVISKIPPQAKEIWLLTNENCETGRECLPLENYVAAHYTVIQEKKFYKETVRLLRKK